MGVSSTILPSHNIVNAHAPEGSMLPQSSMPPIFQHGKPFKPTGTPLNIHLKYSWHPLKLLERSNTLLKLFETTKNASETS